MATEREYQEWQRYKNQQQFRRSSRKNNNSPFKFLLLTCVVAVAIVTYSSWSTLFSINGNSLESLTREFIIDTNEEIVFSSDNKLDSSNFYIIDEIAKTIEYNGNSTSELAEILSQNSSTDTEKARIIYSWITNHIIYDVPALENLLADNIYPNVSTKAVLTSKATICSGYANLYQQLATKLGLKSVIVLGYAKGGDYIVGNDNQVNHAWNGVKIDGNWYLIDSTWGAGTVQNKVFKPQFNPFYFATNPPEFIYTHFPQDDKWQLLTNTYTRTKFDNLPDVSADLFKYNIKLISHQSEKITADDRVSVIIEANSNIVAMAKLSSPEIPINGTHTLVQRQGKNIVINATFPEQGSYKLDIFAKPKDGNNSYPLIVSYQIVANSSGLPMPKTFVHFHENNGYIQSPLQGKLGKNQPVYFKIKIDNATDVQIVDNSSNTWQKLTRYGDNLFAGNVNNQSASLTVFAKFNGDSSYWALAEYN